MRIRALGETCQLLDLDTEPAPGLSRRLAAAAEALRREAGVRDAVPGYSSLALHHDPRQLEPTAAAALLRRAWSASLDRGAETRRHRIPVRYDGPDLAAVAAHCGLPVTEVVRRHAEPVYTVACIGFRPHFPYLLGLDPALVTPRLDAPRTRVPAGAVGIADTQTGIYPSESPGGWRLIGRCDPACCLALEVGDELVFLVEEAAAP